MFLALQCWLGGAPRPRDAPCVGSRRLVALEGRKQVTMKCCHCQCQDLLPFSEQWCSPKDAILDAHMHFQVAGVKQYQYAKVKRVVSAGRDRNDPVRRPNILNCIRIWVRERDPPAIPAFVGTSFAARVCLARPRCAVWLHHERRGCSGRAR